MKSLNKITTLILLFFVLPIQAQSELDTYLRIGAENNPGLRSKFAEYNAALEMVPQVGTLPDPSISFGYFISPIETRIGPQQGKISIAQMFPWFGTLNSQEDVYIERAKSSYEAFEEAKSKLFYDIKSAYFEIYFVEKAIKITEENITILNTFQQLALINIETSKGSLVDEMRVEMELNELENQLIYLKDTKRTIEIEFYKSLNESSFVELMIPEVLWADDLRQTKQDLQDSMLIQNHLIKEIEYKIKSWENQEIAARKQGSPKISLGLDYAFIGNSDNPNLGNENGRDAIMPMIGITLPLYRKKYTAMVKEASYKMEASKFSKTDKQNELTVLFEQNYKEYNDAGRRVRLYEEQLKLANKSLRIMLTAYSSDGQNFEEVLRMERKVLKYALELDKARADKNATVAFINYLTGK